MLAFVICEALEGRTWQVEARFFVRSGRDLRALLTAAGVGDRGHLPDVSVTVRGDLLMEDRKVSGRTFLAAAELEALAGQASPEDQPRMRAWHAFVRTLEAGSRPTRLIVWFVG